MAPGRGAGAGPSEGVPGAGWILLRLQASHTNVCQGKSFNVVCAVHTEIKIIGGKVQNRQSKLKYVMKLLSGNFVIVDEISGIA